MAKYIKKRMGKVGVRCFMVKSDGTKKMVANAKCGLKKKSKK
jgi:hypothetical protein